MTPATVAARIHAAQERARIATGHLHRYAAHDRECASSQCSCEGTVHVGFCPAVGCTCGLTAALKEVRT